MWGHAARQTVLPKRFYRAFNDPPELVSRYFLRTIIMHMKFISFIAGAGIILAGCANQSQYPLTGAAIGPGDSVQFMAAPDVARY